VAAAAALAAVLAAAGAGAAGATDANEEGAALFAAGRYEEAAARFRDAAAADPGAPGPRHNLAAALASLGQRDLLAGRLEEARPRIDEALRLVPDDAGINELLAALELARGELYAARRAAERALGLAPGSAGALELLGDVEYREGFLDAAARRWEQARAAGGAREAALRAKLERLAREAEAERAFGRGVSPHFTVQYDGTVPAPVAREVLRLLEEQHARLAREFRSPPRHDIPVILTSRVLFAAVTGGPAWAGGAYDGKIRVPVGGIERPGDARELGPVLAHELAHAFLRANVAAPLPLWLEEGLAEHLAGADPEVSRRLLRASGGGFPDLAAVDTALRGGGRVRAAYAAAHLAVAELARAGGPWALRRLVELAGDGAALPEALRAAAGLGPAELEERWRAAH